MINIVIPMAGRGSRFSAAGYSDPKPLIMLNDKRMIEVVVNNLRPVTAHRFIFICQSSHVREYKLEQILQHIAPGAIIVPVEGITEGAACTVLAAKALIDNAQPLMIANSDQWVDTNINHYLQQMEDRSLNGLIMTMTASDPKWSYACCDIDGNVVSVTEKQVVSDQATVGIYNYRYGSDFCRFAEQMIRNDDRSQGEFYVAPVYNYMLAAGRGPLGVVNIGSEMKGMYGLGTPADLQAFCRLPVYHQAINFGTAGGSH
ncbi:glycosyl transferase family 2 [Tatumella morbirosei]|uniref:Glycosyl transferase family 2 n=1 Tax=Tatumella morbirosei TaxID=642227 RepID=A0A095TD92_9GAMM|nr:glycosyltransferase family 2 protein [Tatumella morbirosei]KGD74881.1 glycosyl transferase family 2 [Tatumella morbirosei]